MITRRFLFAGLLALALVQSAVAALRVATLNTFLLFSPDNHEVTSMKREEMPRPVYEQKVSNLSSLIIQSGADFVGLEEIGSAIEAGDLAAALSRAGGSGWKALFVPGMDTYTGENVAAVVRMRPGLTVANYSRVAALEHLSKHLVVTVVADGQRYDICVVHLIRPIGKNEGKHRGQVESLAAWVAGEGTHVCVVLGDFNDTGRTLLPVFAANELTGWAPTHVTNKTFDQIYSSVRPTSAEVLRPPYAPRPNDATKQLWTDHYLLDAALP
jgi:hypothetical protein